MASRHHPQSSSAELAPQSHRRVYHTRSRDNSINSSAATASLPAITQATTGTSHSHSHSHSHEAHSHAPVPSHTHAHDSHEQSDDDEEELAITTRPSTNTTNSRNNTTAVNNEQHRNKSPATPSRPSVRPSNNAEHDEAAVSDVAAGGEGEGEDEDADGDGDPDPEPLELDSLDESDEEGSDSYGSEDDYAWIPWFCALKGNEFFCEVEEEFAQDAFNLTGLEQLVPYFDQSLDMILDVEITDTMTEETQEMIENDAENLFGLIHARYILTSRGLQAMLEKYRLFHFGRCPRVLCRGQAILPVGLSDTPNEDNVKLYCPRCEEVYNTRSPRHEHIDGAYFGTTFAHLFYLTFPELKTAKSKELYIPRVFGFRIHKSAYRKSLEARKKEKEKEKERIKRDRAKQQQIDNNTSTAANAANTVATPSSAASTQNTQPSPN